MNKRRLLCCGVFLIVVLIGCGITRKCNNTMQSDEWALLLKERAVAEVRKLDVHAVIHSDISITQHGDEWLVLVLREPLTPGGHYLVVFDRQGNVVRVSRGR